MEHIHKRNEIKIRVWKVARCTAYYVFFYINMLSGKIERCTTRAHCADANGRPYRWITRQLIRERDFRFSGLNSFRFESDARLGTENVHNGNAHKHIRCTRVSLRIPFRAILPIGIAVAIVCTTCTSSPIVSAYFVQHNLYPQSPHMWGTAKSARNLCVNQCWRRKGKHEKKVFYWSANAKD